jgi:hypothetical protein
MAVSIIPTNNDFDAFQFRIDLDSVLYLLVFQYNRREESWFFDLLQDDGTPIRHGVKIHVDWPLWRLIQDNIRPAGDVVLIDGSGTVQTPDLDQLGDPTKLTYLDADEVAAL